MLDLIIKNGSCYIDKDLKNKDIAIKDGKIIEIGKIDSEAKEILDVEDVIASIFLVEDLRIQKN